MDDGLKQRLIGAFVLLALAVIFVPVMFDRERMVPVDKKTQIPAAPYIEPVTVEEIKPPEVKEEAEAPEEMYVPDANVVIDEVAEAPSYDDKGVPRGWVLQIASFRFEEHAEQLRDKLLADGYASYTRSVSTDRGKMTRLYVGPKLDKEVLLAQKKEIEAKHKVSAIVLKFEP